MPKFHVLRGFSNKELITLLRESTDLIEKYRGPLPASMKDMLTDLGRKLSTGMDATEEKKNAWLFIDSVDQFLLENHERLNEMADRLDSIRESARASETAAPVLPGGT
jgi:hypothetical protein